ncbi:MAG TPA: hypothetical protein VI731_08230 [Bacteroidia bacterium]|nr:hypothetical protein [Bacteroidia bacterium]
MKGKGIITNRLLDRLLKFEYGQTQRQISVRSRIASVKQGTPYEERFDLLLRLIRISKMLAAAGQNAQKK